jgi:hypothetical protein
MARAKGRGSATPLASLTVAPLWALRSHAGLAEPSPVVEH